MSRRLLYVASLCALLFGGSALAYLLPADSILRKLGERRNELQLSSMVVQGVYAVGGDSAKELASALKLPLIQGELQLPATATFKMPGRCRIELGRPAGTAAEMPAEVNARGKLKSIGKELEVLRVHAALGCPLLDQRGTGEEAEGIFISFLTGLKIDLSVVSLGRFAGEVDYVLGARPRVLNQPQLWVVKEGLHPTRLIAKEGDALLELRLVDYSSPASGEWHPRVVEIRKGEALLGRFTSEKVETNSKVSDALF